MSLPQIDKAESALPRRPKPRTPAQENLKRNSKPFQDALRKAFDGAKEPQAHKNAQRAHEPLNKRRPPASKTAESSTQNQRETSGFQRGTSDVHKTGPHQAQTRQTEARSPSSPSESRDDVAAEGRNDTQRSGSSEASDNAREAKADRDDGRDATDDKAAEQRERLDDEQSDDNPQESENDSLRELQLIATTHPVLMAAMGSPHRSAAATAPAAVAEIARSSDGAGRHRTNKAQMLRAAQAHTRSATDQTSGDVDLATQDELSDDADALLNEQRQAPSTEANHTALTPVELAAEFSTGPLTNASGSDAVSIDGVSKAGRVGGSGGGRGKMSASDATEMARLMRARRQQAAMKVVNRMTLRHGTHANVDVPELGRIRISARTVGGEVDIKLNPLDSDALAVLHSASAALEADLRNASIELRNLDIHQDLSAEEEDAFEQADARDAEGSDDEATDEPRDNSISGGHDDVDPKQVRIVL